MASNGAQRYTQDESFSGSRSYETENDFASEKDAKNAITAYFKNQECEKCGFKDLSGDNVLVEITKISLHHEVKEKVFYRVGNILFPQAHIFSSGGHFKCTNSKCKHRMGSLSYMGQWASNYINR